MHDTVTRRQIMALLFIFLTGSSMTVGYLGRDGWLSILLAALAAVPLCFIYLRPVWLCPGESFFSVNRLLYGKIIGGLINFLYSALGFLALVFSLAAFISYIHTVSLSETPRLLIGLPMALSAAVLVRGGVRRLARWAEPVFYVVLLSLIVSCAMTAQDLSFARLQPILYDGMRPVVQNGARILAAPFLEGFFLISLLERSREKKRSLGGVVPAVLLSGAVILMVYLRNSMLLGEGAWLPYYPSYTAASLITLGDFFQREEVLVSGSYVLCDLLKIAVLLSYLVRGCQSFSPRLPVGVSAFVFSALALAGALFCFDGVMDFLGSLPFYRSMLFFPLLLFPALTWLLAEGRFGIFRRKAGNAKN